MAENRVIGRDNRLPWRLPADLAHFKRVTMGKPVIMGRRTYESIGRPLPGRHNIVVSRNLALTLCDCTVVGSPAAALAAAAGCAEALVIGGAALYRFFLPQCERIYLTLVHARPEGDTRFPAFEETAWQELSREHHPADERNQYDYSFIVLERRAGVAEVDRNATG
jgi:dihydrofolate reductase